MLDNHNQAQPAKRVSFTTIERIIRLRRALSLRGFWRDRSNGSNRRKKRNQMVVGLIAGPGAEGSSNNSSGSNFKNLTTT